MLELFKGQLSIEDLKHNLTHKEALLLREIRSERLRKEREELEKERAKEAEAAKREANRSKIILPS